MATGKLLARWNSDPTISSNIYARYTEPARMPVESEFPDDLHPNIINALNKVGVNYLYSHQLQAWIHIKNKKNIVVATGTASGKSYCYNLPILNLMLKNQAATALYLFPTKALAQDQANSLEQLINLITQLTNNAEINRIQKRKSYPTHNPHTERSIPLAIYDGDTPSDRRGTIRASARIIFSNPDMLHVGILPHHTSWDTFLSNLSFIVIDEIHKYRGVFGSHVANIFRRLTRVLKFYGSSPQFILTSATIANPGQLGQRLINQPLEIITDDGSLRGKKNFLIYNPPIIDQDLGLRRSAYHETVRLAEDLHTQEIQTIIFCRSRRTVELILSYLREKISSTKDRAEKLIRGYRSGYLPEQRRQIEEGIRNGNIRIVTATNALELGIDVGGMGAVILVGYPGTIAATRQQVGRAGRGAQESLAILIATPDPIDQFFANNPQYLLDRPSEEALINPDNTLIMLSHIQSAAFELPFSVHEGFGDLDTEVVHEYLDFCSTQGLLHKSGEKYYWMADYYPAQSISIRTTSAENIELVLYNDQESNGKHNRMVGRIDRISAYWMVHPHAIYLHEGETYFVEDLDFESNQALLRPFASDYYTLPQKRTEIKLINKHLEEKTTGALKEIGEIIVTEQVTGYRKIRWYTHENIGSGELDLPPTHLNTTAYWFSLDEDTVTQMRERGIWGSDQINYGPNWNQQRDRVRERDNFRCQICGSPESSRAHDVHHKIPFRQFTSYQQANKLDNLVTLCPSCHKRLEASVRIRSGLSGLTFILSHLSTIFLMCDPRDIGVHSDPQSNLANGKPTVVIYDQVPDGIGFSQRLFELHTEIIDRAYKLVRSCQCKGGCPSCVGPGGELGRGGKYEVIEILEILSAGKRI